MSDVTNSDGHNPRRSQVNSGENGNSTDVVDEARFQYALREARSLNPAWREAERLAQFHSLSDDERYFRYRIIHPERIRRADLLLYLEVMELLEAAFSEPKAFAGIEVDPQIPRDIRDFIGSRKKSVRRLLKVRAALDPNPQTTAGVSLYSLFLGLIAGAGIACFWIPGYTIMGVFGLIYAVGVFGPEIIRQARI